MKAWIFSDLYVELGNDLDTLSIPTADVCICAGNVMTGELRQSVRWLGERVSPHMPVILVPGNREYYRGSLTEGLALGVRTASEYPELHVLDREFVDVHGVRFVGATLWTDFDLLSDRRNSMRIAGTQVEDFRRIELSRSPRERLSPRKSAVMHLQARHRIAEILRQAHSGQTVVVTHHALHRSLPFTGDPLSPAYASILDDLLEQFEPSLWVHGHLTNRCDYYVNRTRVISNPRGHLPNFLAPGFDPGLLVEL